MPVIVKKRARLFSFERGANGGLRCGHKRDELTISFSFSNLGATLTPNSRLDVIDVRVHMMLWVWGLVETVMGDHGSFEF
jgi:hypothetical protein